MFTMRRDLLNLFVLVSISKKLLNFVANLVARFFSHWEDKQNMSKCELVLATGFELGYAITTLHFSGQICTLVWMLDLKFKYWTDSNGQWDEIRVLKSILFLFFTNYNFFHPAFFFINVWNVHLNIHKCSFKFDFTPLWQESQGVLATDFFP